MSATLSTFRLTVNNVYRFNIAVVDRLYQGSVLGTVVTY